MTLHHVAKIEPQPGYRVLVHWVNEGQSLIDFSSDVANGPVWAPLRDQRLFAKVRVVDYGRVIEWPEPGQGPDWPQVDIDADGLWHMAQAQSAAVAAE
jgi:hypothetical protein